MSRRGNWQLGEDGHSGGAALHTPEGCGSASSLCSPGWPPREDCKVSGPSSRCLPPRVGKGLGLGTGQGYQDSDDGGQWLSSVGLHRAHASPEEPQDHAARHPG